MTWGRISRCQLWRKEIFCHFRFPTIQGIPRSINFRPEPFSFFISVKVYQRYLHILIERSSSSYYHMWRLVANSSVGSVACSTLTGRAHARQRNDVVLHLPTRGMWLVEAKGFFRWRPCGKQDNPPQRPPPIFSTPSRSQSRWLFTTFTSSCLSSF